MENENVLRFCLNGYVFKNSIRKSETAWAYIIPMKRWLMLVNKLLQILFVALFFKLDEQFEKKKKRTQ